MGLVCVGLWSIIMSGIFFLVLWIVGILRIDIGSEIIGYDFMDYSDINFEKKKLVRSKEGRSIISSEGPLSKRKGSDKEDLPPVINPRDQPIDAQV